MRTHAVHFLAGMPRAGTTLLGNILSQNPIIDVTSTSYMYEVVFGMRQAFQTSDQRKAQQDHKYAREKFYGAVSGALFGSFLDAPVGIDKNRNWLECFSLIAKALPQSKIICPVRDIAGVLSSFEKLYQQAPEYPKNEQMLTVTDRCQYLLKNGPLHKSMVLLKSVIDSRVYQDQICFVRYEDLVQQPEKTARMLYEFLNINFPDNFDMRKIPNDLTEHDAIHYPFGEHSSGSMLLPESNNILPVELQNAVRESNSWFCKAFNY